MATESLNASATEFRPQAQAYSAENAADTNGGSRDRKPRSRSRRKKPTGDGAETPRQSHPSPSSKQSQPTPQNAEATATSLVPASVRRRRKPTNGKTDKPANGDAAAASGEATSKPKKSNHKQQRNAAKTAQVAEQDADEDVEVCLLCADPIQFHAVGECNHHGICSKCSLRMRMLMNDRSCPICKQHLERVVVCRDKLKFESFELWGDAAAGGRESVMDEASEIIFYECRSHYNTLRALREYVCRVKKCRVVCGSMQKLKDHLRIEHGTEFCELCLTHQHFFVQEHQVFSKSGLRAHNVGKNRSVGPKASGKDFHPMCQFCKRRFYSDMQLYEHLERDHFRCHLCKTEHEYFRNYTSLESHFRREHHLCEDPRCLENRYVVFGNDIEYHAHMRNIHGVLNRLVLNFQVARSGENPLGGPLALGGDEVPDSWSYETQEAVVDRRVQPVDTAFPALPTPATPTAPVPSAPAIAPRAAVTRVSSASSFSARSNGSVNGAPPRAQIVRNQRLAEALGLARPGQSAEDFEQEMKTPKYPAHLVEWGKANLSYLQVVERRLERIVQDAGCHSVSLRPMPAEERALMHELATFYGVPSESFGEDPFRRISFFKRDTAVVPEVTLSKFLRGNTVSRASSASRLSFLPLRGQPQPAPRPPPRPAIGINRGWEKIEPKPARPAVADAWSDDEQDHEDGEQCSPSGDNSSPVSFDDEENDEDLEEKPTIKSITLDEDFEDVGTEETSTTSVTAH